MYWEKKLLDTFQEFSSGETVLGHLEKVDEVPIVHDGDFVLIHIRHLPW